MNMNIKRQSYLNVAIAILMGFLFIWYVFLCFSKGGNSDEKEHLYASFLITKGFVPYRDFFEHHHPLLWYLFSPIVWLFSNSENVLYAMRCVCLAILLGSVGVGMIVILILIAPYRFQRITSFLDPWSDPLGTGFQIIQSMYAIGPGGLLGVGLFNSYQKHFYLPEPQTDFIFAIIVEELGLIGGIVLLFVFGLLFYFGFKLARLQSDSFESFMIFGLLGIIAIQVIINLGVVTALFPVTGITLPLISYGGTSLSITLFSIGLILGRKSNENIISC